jgi:hypothetical protein
MKSRAPRRIASTATSTLPQAVITTTGSVGSMPWMRDSRIQPSFARRRVARVVQVDQADVEFTRFDGRQHAGGEEAVSRRTLRLEQRRSASSTSD